MVRCWKHSQNSLEEAQCTDGGPSGSPKFPHRAFWASVSASVVLVVIALGLTGNLGLPQHPSQSLQIIRSTIPDQTGTLTNQSALVDKQKDLVTVSVTSQVNQTSTVIYDIKHGLICFKPDNQDSCFLHKMEKSDYDNVHSFQSTSKNQFQLSVNRTQRQTEFLGVLGASQVDLTTLEDSLKDLCQFSSIHWTQRVKGPGKQRLVYFCIDICFPNNICVSVCFYYLPE